MKSIVVFLLTLAFPLLWGRQLPYYLGDIYERDQAIDELAKEPDDFGFGNNLNEEFGFGPDTSSFLDEEDKMDGGSGETDDFFYNVPQIPSVKNVQDEMKVLEDSLKAILTQALDDASNFNGTSKNVTEEVEDEFGGKFKVQTLIKKGSNNHTMVVETIEAIQPPANRTKRSNWFAEPYQ